MRCSRRHLLVGLSCLLSARCSAAEPRATPRPPDPPKRPLAPDRPERSIEPWRRALGPLDDVEPALRAVFTDPRDFAPMPPQRRGDWRSVRPEEPQSVADFLASNPHRRLPPRDRLALLPLGRFPYDVIIGADRVSVVRSPPLADIAALLAAFFATPTDLLPPGEPLRIRVPWRQRHGVRQFNAPALLGALAPQLPADVYGMLTLVTVDLYAARDDQFVYGWSTYHNRLAVIGFVRLDPSFDGGPAPPDVSGTILRRSLRVAVHEVGHLFGLAHCQAFHCVMNGIADLDELDAVPLRMCPLCLRKLHLVTGLDLRARDAALLEAFEALGLPEEADWLRRRARRLELARRDHS